MCHKKSFRKFSIKKSHITSAMPKNHDRMVEVFGITCSLLDKNKIQKLKFFLAIEWFTLTENVNSQHNTEWCDKNPLASHQLPLHDLRVRVWRTGTANKITGGPHFF
jgi:hypothetical protein